MERTLRAALLVVLFCLPLGVVVLFDGQAIAGRPNTFASPKLYLLESLIAASLGMWVWLRRPGLSALRPYGGIAVTLAVAALSAWWAPNVGLATTATVHLVVAFALMLMLAQELRDGTFARQACWTLAAATALQAGWGIVQYVLQHDLGLQLLGESLLGPAVENVAKLDLAGGKQIRAYGSLPHPNVLAAYLAAAIFWVGTIILWPTELFGRGGRLVRLVRYRNLGMAALLTLLGAGLLLTFSRVAILITVINGGLVVAFAMRRWKRLPAAAGIAAAAFFVLALLLLPQFQSRGNVETATETNVSNRVVGFELAAQMIADRPLGVGAGNFVPAAAEIRADLPNYQYQPVHNAPLLIAAELGAIPMLLILAFIARIGWLFHRLRPADLRANSINFSLFALSGALIAIGLTDHFFWSLPQGLWLVAVVAAAVISRVPEQTFAGQHHNRRHHRPPRA